MHLGFALEAERLRDEPALVAVATRKINRTERLLPETAFADQVSSCHGSHSNANSSATLPAPLQLGLSTSSPTS